MLQFLAAQTPVNHQALSSFSSSPGLGLVLIGSQAHSFELTQNQSPSSNHLQAFLCPLPRAFPGQGKDLGD